MGTLEVLTVSERRAILLLALGVNPEAQELFRMGKTVDNVSVLLLAGQGYAPLKPPEWIENFNPQLVLLSVAADDQDGLPDRETIDALGGYSLQRTDQHGWIKVTTDGEHMWVEVEKNIGQIPEDLSDVVCGLFIRVRKSRLATGSAKAEGAV